MAASSATLRQLDQRKATAAAAAVRHQGDAVDYQQIDACDGARRTAPVSRRISSG
jgi:hypothetical protein